MLLLDIVDRGVRPVIARVTVPMLARGDECITKTGCYGDLMADARLLERDGTAVAAGVMIGNPFTDVPELCTQVIVSPRRRRAASKASDPACRRRFWPRRHPLQGKLIALDQAVAQARRSMGPSSSPTPPTRPRRAPAAIPTC